MNRLVWPTIGAAWLAIALVRCSQSRSEPAAVVTEVQRPGADSVTPVRLFAVAGCTVYRFVDSVGVHYLTARPAGSAFFNDHADPCSVSR